MKKFLFLAPGVAGLAALLAPAANAVAMVPVPATLGSSFLAKVGSQLADPETLILIAVVIALPLTFWIIKRLIGLIPKGK